MSKKEAIILKPYDRATLCLQGLSVGDAFGYTLNRQLKGADETILNRRLPPAPWQVGDDTVMTMAVLRNLTKWGKITAESLAKHMANRYDRTSTRGYGGTEHLIFRQILDQVPWQEASSQILGGAGSAGIAASPRAAIIGAYFAEETLATHLKEVIDQAKASAQVTHYHPEGQAGAVAVALAAYYLAHAGKGHIHRRVGQDMLEFVGEHLEDSKTRERVIIAQKYDAGYAIDTMIERLGNGSKLAAWDAVPFALWAAARFLDDFADAMWRTALGGGTRDANCAIVGGLIAVAHGIRMIPLQWLERREPLPDRYNHKS